MDPFILELNDDKSVSKVFLGGASISAAAELCVANRLEDERERIERGVTRRSKKLAPRFFTLNDASFEDPHRLALFESQNLAFGLFFAGNLETQALEGEKLMNSSTADSEKITSSANGASTSFASQDILETKLDDAMAFAVDLQTAAPEIKSATLQARSEIEDALNLARKVKNNFGHIKSEPVNMRILSGQLDGAGAALATISQNYDKMAGEMSELLTKLDSEETGSLFFLQNELVSVFYAINTVQTIDAEAVNVPEHEAVLADVIEELKASISGSVSEMKAATLSVPDVCRQLRRRVNGLDVVKLLCRVESGRVSVGDTGLSGIIDRLEDFHSSTDRNLVEISRVASSFRSSLGKIDASLMA